MVFNLRTVESAFTRKNIVLDARSIQCIHQSFFCFIPSCVVTDTFFRTCCNLVGNIGKAVVGVNLLNELGVSGAFGKNLIFCTEDVPIVLSETADAHQAVQRAGRFISVAGTEFTVADRQIAVGANGAVENLNVARAVHRFQSVVTVFRLCREHVFFVLRPVTGFFPERTV